MNAADVIRKQRSCQAASVPPAATMISIGSPGGMQIRAFVTEPDAEVANAFEEFAIVSLETITAA